MDLTVLRAGDIVVTSCDPSSWESRAVAWFGGSKWTHIFIIKDANTLLESAFPQGAKGESVPERFVSLAKNRQDFVVLRVVGLTPEELAKTIETADSWLGRKYDVLQAIIFGLFHFFIDDGPKRAICSRYVAGAFTTGGHNLFSKAVLLARAGANHPRFHQMEKGWTIPNDFIEFADVTKVV